MGVAVEIKLRAPGDPRPVVTFLGSYGPLCKLKGIIIGFKTIIINFQAKKGQNGPFWAIFWEFLRREGPKDPKNLVNGSLYLYRPCAIDRSGFWTLTAENEFFRGLACLLACCCCCYCCLL